MKWVHSALLVSSVALTASCAVGPRYHRPEAPANAGYAPTPLPQSSASAPIHGGEVQRLIDDRDIPFEWWQLFQSPALNALVERAFRANPTIAAAEATLVQAQELVYAQRGYFFPTIGANYDFERQKIAGNFTLDDSPGTQGNGDNLNPPLLDVKNTPHTAPLIYNFQTAQLTVGFVPDVFGANRRQMESLAAQRDAQRFALEATYITLASNVVAAAIQEASLRAQIEATQQIIAADEKSLQILRDQFQLGFAMRIDVAAQETALAQAKATLPPLQKQFEQTRDLIRALVGNLPNQEVPETFELDALQLPPELPLSLPAKIIDQRPDVRSAEAQLRAANAQVGVAVAAMLPQFSITGAYGGNADEFAWMFRHGGPFWSLVGNVAQPVFEGGTLLHRKRAADDALKQAAAQYQISVLTAYQNVADTLHASLSDADALAANVRVENAAKVTYDLTRRQMEVGYVNYLILLNAETVYQQALLVRVQAQATRYGDTVALFQALGGGWWNRK
ncbi:MAG TPA: efflux transporter outer membrane subunit [Steroidobacteraceae bacterium]|nr:efflux transporter outer membrane subunit [Steroidobacteraceae bacterium]